MPLARAAIAPRHPHFLLSPGAGFRFVCCPCMATQRIVLKFGSGILARPEGNALDDGQFRNLAEAVAGLVKSGAQCIVVSSGAVAAGMPVLGLTERPGDLAMRQACAAAGQSKLMGLYSE